MDKEDKRRLKSQFRNEYPIFLRKDKDGDGVDKATFRFILKDLGDLWITFTLTFKIAAELILTPIIIK